MRCSLEFPVLWPPKIMCIDLGSVLWNQHAVILLFVVKYSSCWKLKLLNQYRCTAFARSSSNPGESWRFHFFRVEIGNSFSFVFRPERFYKSKYLLYLLASTNQAWTPQRGFKKCLCGVLWTSGTMNGGHMTEWVCACCTSESSRVRLCVACVIWP